MTDAAPASYEAAVERRTALPGRERAGGVVTQIPARGAELAPHARRAFELRRRYGAQRLGVRLEQRQLTVRATRGKSRNDLHENRRGIRAFGQRARERCRSAVGIAGAVASCGEIEKQVRAIAARRPGRSCFMSSAFSP